jgi:ATP-dependent RNA helicase DDX21
MMQQVEKRAGLIFKHITAPTSADIVKAAGSDALRAIESVPASVTAQFEDLAQSLIEARGGALPALAAALAHISGATELKQRSVLSSMSGFTAYQMTLDKEARSKGFLCVEEEKRRR